MGRPARFRPAHGAMCCAVASWRRNQRTTVMNSFPPPAIVAAFAAVIASPFSIAAAGTLLLTASLGFIIHADYVQRLRRVRLPRLSTPPQACTTPSALCGEVHQLAA